MNAPLERVKGYWTGDFIGRVVERNEMWGLATYEVVDPLRPYKRLCDFPNCVLKLHHDGDHELRDLKMRPGVRVEVWLDNAKVKPSRKAVRQ